MAGGTKDGLARTALAMIRSQLSIETALVQLLDYDSIYHAADNGKATLLFSLDLSAAFDTIDHSILLHRLAHSFGLTGSALTWVQCFSHISLADLKLFV